MDEYCDHDLKELMMDVSGTYEFVGLEFCTKCRRIYKRVLEEVKY